MNFIPDYSRARLLEALSTIGTARSLAKEGQRIKEIESIYRDPINTRGARNCPRYTDLAYASDDNEDDNYDPAVTRKVSMSRKAVSHRSRTSDGHITYSVIRKKEPERRKRTAILSSDPHKPFLSLKLALVNSKKLLAALSTKYNTNIKQLSNATEDGEPSAFGEFEKCVSCRDTTFESKLPHSGNAHDTGSAQPYPARLSHVLAPRRLRNGKLLAFQSRKRKRSNDSNKSPKVRPTQLCKETTQTNRVTSVGKDTPQSVQRPPFTHDVQADQYRLVKRARLDNLNASRSEAREHKLDRMLRNGTDPALVQAFLEQADESPGAFAHDVKSNRCGVSQESAILISDSEEDTKRSMSKPEYNTAFGINGKPIPKTHNQTELTDVDTAFSHPIDFRSRKDCDFCRDYRFGLVGCGLRSITVTWNPREPSRYLETGGSQSEHQPRTKMCIICAIARLTIIHCPGHTFERYFNPNVDGVTRSGHEDNRQNNGTDVQRDSLPLGEGNTIKQGVSCQPMAEMVLNTAGLDAKAPMVLNPFEYSTANTDLSSSHVPTSPLDDYFTHITQFLHHPRPPNRKPPYHTPCSICLNPATHKCKSYQTHNARQQPCFQPSAFFTYNAAQRAKAFAAQERAAQLKGGPHLKLQPSIKGCGLLLCSACLECVQRCSGKLDESVLRWVRFRQREGDEKTLDRPRADMEFLFEQGLLWKDYHGDKSKEEVERRRGTVE